MQYNGLVTYVGYFLSFWNEIINYLFVSIPGMTIWFSRLNVQGNGPATDGDQGQWIVNGNMLPGLTDKGSDIMAAIMTIVHNGIVAVAQLSTLLPANALT